MKPVYLRGERVTLYPENPDAPTGQHEPVVVIARVNGRYRVKKRDGTSIAVVGARLARQDELPL
jgi:hypothetical protein